MPEIKKYRHGVPCWVDVASPDLARTAEFYSTLFGWEAFDQGPDAGNYHMLRKGGLDVAGLGPATPGQPPAWSTYLNVDDVDAAVAAAEKAGGSVMVPVMDVMEFGRMSFVTDSAGAFVGLWQAGTTIGSRIVNETASPVWHELATKDLTASQRFYSDVVGWTYQPMDPGADGGYQICQVSGRAVGGMMPFRPEMPAEAPSHWTVYFAVSDVDATARRATELGGMIVAEPFDTPVGRSAVLRDSTGAAFSVIALANPADHPDEGWQE